MEVDGPQPQPAAPPVQTITAPAVAAAAAPAAATTNTVAAAAATTTSAPIIAAVPAVVVPSTSSVPAAAPNTCCANVVTIPVPIVPNEDYYTYVTVKGSLHDRSCTIFGLNETETQALSKRFENSVKPAVNGIMISVPPMLMVNTLAQLSYKVVCSSGDSEICWTMQREI